MSASSASSSSGRCTSGGACSQGFARRAVPEAGRLARGSCGPILDSGRAPVIVRWRRLTVPWGQPTTEIEIHHGVQTDHSVWALAVRTLQNAHLSLVAGQLLARHGGRSSGRWRALARRFAGFHACPDRRILRKPAAQPFVLALATVEQTVAVRWLWLPHRIRVVGPEAGTLGAHHSVRTGLAIAAIEQTGASIRVGFDATHRRCARLGLGRTVANRIAVWKRANGLFPRRCVEANGPVVLPASIEAKLPAVAELRISGGRRAFLLGGLGLRVGIIRGTIIFLGDRLTRTGRQQYASRKNRDPQCNENTTRRRFCLAYDPLSHSIHYWPSN